MRLRHAPLTSWLLFPLLTLAAGCGDNAEGPAPASAGPEDQTSGAGAVEPEDEGSAPTAVESEEQTSAMLPSLAMNEDGTAVVVWAQTDGSSYEIWSNQYTPAGGWGAAAPIDGSRGVSTSGPQVAIDRDGNAVAVWDRSEAAAVWDKSVGTPSDIWASRYTPGTGWTAAERIENDDVGFAVAPNLAMDGAGNALVAWSVSGNTGSITDAIAVNRFEPETGWHTAEVVADSTAESLGSVRVAANAGGEAVLVYVSSVGTARSTLSSRRYAPATGWEEATVVATVDYGGGSVAAFSEPGVALANDGTALAVWQTVVHPLTEVMFASAPTSGGWTVPEQSSGSAAAPRLFLDTTGEGLVFWVPSSFADAVGAVTSRHYDPSAGWGAAEAIQGKGSDSPSTPYVAGSGAGLFAAAWSRSSDGESTVWLDRYESGTGWRTATSIATTSLVDPSPRVAVDAAGNTLLVWLTGDAAHSNLVAKTFPVE